MFRIRKVGDDTTPANRFTIEQTQSILREQFSGMPVDEIDKLSEQLRDPLKYRFGTLLYVAEDSRDRVLGCAIVLHAPDVGFCYLETISAAPGGTGGGVGAALYERVREVAVSLKAGGVFFECLPDDPKLSPNPSIRKQNIARLRFYERFGARPIVGTEYETPITPGDTDPPYLVYDGLGREGTPAKKQVRTIVRAILERKYGSVCSPAYIDRVVESFTDDPIRLRPARYVREEPVAVVKKREAAELIPMIVNERHEIHHVRDRGYVESPVRIRSILAELAKTPLFETVPALHFPLRHVRAVHDSTLVDYLKRACASVEEGRSLYPYVFPIRNQARPPKEGSVAAGYYCIDTFTPLNPQAWFAACGAVDCALTGAEFVLGGSPLAYALVRPPGHHAERRAFGGFCYFNNAAVAANYLSRFGRVAVLDVDYHHGNGTQDIFYTRADVLTVSVHGHPSFAYPYFAGFREETGIGVGAGYNLNLPLAEVTTPDQHRKAVALGLRRIRRHDPAFLVVSIGFDTAKGDPTGTWANGAEDFDQLGAMIGELGIPTLVVQEGGYRVRTLGSNARRFFTGLARESNKHARLALRPASKAAKAPSGKIVWRESVELADVERIRSLVEATGFFNSGETAIAAELVSERIEKGAASGYSFLLAEDDDTLVGYSCYGEIPATDARYDLYWIVVDRTRQRSGMGREILARTESSVRARGGKRIYVDTSGGDLYDPTRRFYAACGYRKIAELKDFYREKDAKVIFAKDL